MVSDRILLGDLSLTIDAGHSIIIQVSNAFSYLGLETYIDTDGTYSIYSSNISSEEFSNLTSLNDLNKDYIQVGLLKYVELNFSIDSIFYAPNYLFIENTSTDSQSLIIDIRCNKC
jgi:hypothetical protein